MRPGFSRARFGFVSKWQGCDCRDAVLARSFWLGAPHHSRFCAVTFIRVQVIADASVLSAADCAFSPRGGLFLIRVQQKMYSQCAYLYRARGRYRRQSPRSTGSTALGDMAKIEMVSVISFLTEGGVGGCLTRRVLPPFLAGGLFECPFFLWSSLSSLWRSTQVRLSHRRAPSQRMAYGSSRFS